MPVIIGDIGRAVIELEVHVPGCCGPSGPSARLRSRIRVMDVVTILERLGCSISGGSFGSAAGLLRPGPDRV